MSRPVVVGAGVAALLLLVLDAAWITLVAGDLYRERMGDLVRESPQLLPAVGFYVLFWAGLVHLVVRPGLAQSLGRVAASGALLGATAYATWGLTGLAVLEGFSTVVALTDVLWGTFLGSVVAVASVAAARRGRG